MFLIQLVFPESHVLCNWEVARARCDWGSREGEFPFRGGVTLRAGFDNLICHPPPSLHTPQRMTFIMGSVLKTPRHPLRTPSSPPLFRYNPYLILLAATFATQAARQGCNPSEIKTHVFESHFHSLVGKRGPYQVKLRIDWSKLRSLPMKIHACAVFTPNGIFGELAWRS
jgi:hypothetical protein